MTDPDAGVPALIRAEALQQMKQGLSTTMDRTAAALAEAVRTHGPTVPPDVLQRIADQMLGQTATVLRTQTQDATYGAQLDAWRGDPEVHGWYLQPRPDCCVTCAVIAGLVFPLGESPWQHPNCRCTLQPLRPRTRLYRGYVTGARMPRARIVAKTPLSWRDNLPADLVDLLIVTDNDQWRPIRQVQRP